MKESISIVDITTRRIRISAEAWFAPQPIPAGHVPWWEFPLTTLETSAGIDGYTMDYGPLGQGRPSAYAIHDIFYHDLVGENPLHHEAIWQKLRVKQRHLYNVTETSWSNLDVALWDIKGKVTGLPLATLLGQHRNRVPVYATCPPQTIPTAEHVHHEVLLKKKQGYAGVKLQLSGGPQQDIPRIQQARAAAGAEFPLMLDSSAVLTFEEALKIGAVLDELRFEWFEEPFADDHILQLQRLSASIRTPVLAAETVSLTELPHFLVSGAVDLVRADVHHKGGITGLMKAMAMCELMGFGLEIHTASAPLLDVANLHVGCASRLSRFLESHHPMFRFGLRGDPLRVQEDGCQHMPQAPGLGVELDWDWIDDHTVEFIRGCEY